MAKGLFDQMLDLFFDAEWIGRRGEKLTERELKLVRFFGRDGKILRNIYVPKGNGETSEIDVVYITRKGIFVIESKNYSGWIFGDEKSAYWTVMLPNKQKNRFYNPIKQNRTHIKWLSQYLNDDTPLFSLIVFSERCELKKVTVESPDVRVIKRDDLYGAVKRIWDQCEDKLGENELEAIYEKLEALTNVEQSVKLAHIDTINQKYKRAEKPVEPVQEEKTTESPRCPCCGGELVLRVAKKGANAGNCFYGCSNYPKCRFVQNL